MQRDYTGKKVAILGYGVNNEELVPLLKDRGAEITICDMKPDLPQDIPGVDYILGDHYLDSLTDFDILFRTPRLPFLHLKIQEAIQAGITVTSQTQLFMEESRAPIIGVTGTKGKGTTSSLIEACLLEAKKRGDITGNIFLAGNIGISPLQFLNKLTPYDWVILELSSFQLHDLTVSPHIAVLLNITQDHLDHHKTLEEYHTAKSSLVRYQSSDDFVVANADSKVAMDMLKHTPAHPYFFAHTHPVVSGAYVRDNRVYLTMQDEQDIEICSLDTMQLVGQHNLENSAAAAITARLAGASVEAIQQAIRLFQGLPHRLQFVAEKDGVRYYNDSFSTQPDATIAAIHSFQQPITLIVGGSPKGADFTELIEVIKNSVVTTVICIGQEGERIQKILVSSTKPRVIAGGSSMPEIVKQAQNATPEGGIVLLSPACASLDMFQDYKDRGNQFITAVNTLK